MRRALFVAALVACGPRVDPAGPSTEPTSVKPSAADDQVAKAAVPPSREVLVGEMCPNGSDGRPGVMPTFMRRISWDDDAERISDALERNMAKQFSVFGWQGKRVGLFTTAGAARRGGRGFAMGSYGGGSSCETAGTEPKAIPDCEKTLLSCGLAVGVLRPAGGFGSAPFEEDPDPDTFATGGACVAGNKLVLDVDGDGTLEAFPTTGFLSPLRAPAEEVDATPLGEKESCTPRFALRGVVPVGDPRDWRGMDVIGILDLDGDGRLEIVAVYNYQDRRTWVVYSARSTSGRLELVAEGQPWPRPSTSRSQPVTGADLPSD